MPHKCHVAAILALAVGVSSQLRADITVKQYREVIASRNQSVVDLTTSYLKGIGEGIVIANVRASMGNRPLFCQPEKLALDQGNFLAILDDTIADLLLKAPKDTVDKMAIGIVLLNGLERTFPCARPEAK